MQHQARHRSPQRRPHAPGWPWVVVACFAAAVMAGCTTPAARFDRAARSLDLVRSEVLGDGFVHVVYAKGTPRTGKALHVYVDGDGMPWVGPHSIASDPTTRSRLILDLLERDPDPALLVGRPCYYRTTPDPACAPETWTGGRYSAQVTSSMASAINRLVARTPGSPVLLIGYSGGGTLAMLTAPALARVDAVVTVAANLDTDAWTAAHDYDPLADSLNPAKQPPLPARIVQWHLAGAADEVVPPALIRTAIAGQPGAHFEVVPGYDHVCCWPERWARVLDEVHARLSAR